MCGVTSDKTGTIVQRTRNIHIQININIHAVIIYATVYINNIADSCHASICAALRKLFGNTRASHCRVVNYNHDV